MNKEPTRLCDSFNREGEHMVFTNPTDAFLRGMKKMFHVELNPDTGYLEVVEPVEPAA